MMTGWNGSPSTRRLWQKTRPATRYAYVFPIPVPASLMAILSSNMASSMVWLRRVCSGRSVIPWAGSTVLKIWSSSVCAFFLVSSFIIIIIPVLFFLPYLQLAPRHLGTARTGSGILTACDWGLYCFQPQRIAACLTCRPDIVCPYRAKCMMLPATAAQPMVLARRLALCHRVVAHRLRFLRSAVLSALLIFIFSRFSEEPFKSPHYPSRKNG